MGWLVISLVLQLKMLINDDGLLILEPPVFFNAVAPHKIPMDEASEVGARKVKDFLALPSSGIGIPAFFNSGSLG